MTFASILLAAALSASEAIAVLLNTPNATSPTRYAAAMEKVREDADKGRPLQQFVLGVTLKDADEARRYRDASRDRIGKLAAERNNSLAWFLLAKESNDVKLLETAADGGNVQALNAYGLMLVKSVYESPKPPQDTGKTLSRALDCFRRAVAQKDPNAYVNLGTCYLHGLGCERDLGLAHQCFRSAAEAGHPEGMDYVSASFEHGHGVEKNLRLAMVWRMKAQAVRGDKAATEWLKK